jgi:hypothetical protein
MDVSIGVAGAIQTRPLDQAWDEFDNFINRLALKVPTLKAVVWRGGTQAWLIDRSRCHGELHIHKMFENDARHLLDEALSSKR